jgi:hypothetical protein
MKNRIETSILRSMLRFGVLSLVVLTAHAGSFENSASEEPTTRKSEDFLHAWDKIIPCGRDCQRFVLVMEGAAVLDKETALVWEQAPDVGRRTWFDASVFCTQRIVGNRLGWRLPTIQELASLVDPAATTRPVIPAGNPFANVQPRIYWSATSAAQDTHNAWIVDFFNGFANGVNGKVDTPSLYHAWCVRGGQGVDPQ